MKWAILVLLIMGVLAGVFAILLVKALRTEQMATLQGSGEVQAVVALRSMPAMTRLTSQNVTVKKIPRKGVATDYFAEPTQVIGKVLAAPGVAKGQVLTKRNLIGEGEGALLAAGLPDGMRAVSVPVPRHSVMGGLLYAGCVVDVIATFRLRSGDTERQAMSTTLLHGVQVLAVDDKSIISMAEQGQEKKGALGGAGSRGQLTVTLMVDTKQAEALQLAMNNGRITLAMKNPLDHKAVPVDGTVLSQGRLAKLGDLMTPSVFAAAGETGYFDANSLEALLEIDANGLTVPPASATGDEAERLRRFFYPESGSRTSPQWQITVIRGKEVKEEVIDIPEDAVKAEN